MIRQLKQTNNRNNSSSNNNLLSEIFIIKNIIIKNYSSTARCHKEIETTVLLKGQLTTGLLFTVLWCFRKSQQVHKFSALMERHSSLANPEYYPTFESGKTKQKG